MKVASLFTGAGGLDLGLHQVWHLAVICALQRASDRRGLVSGRLCVLWLPDVDCKICSKRADILGYAQW